MKLFELDDDQETAAGYYDPNADKMNQAHLGDSRCRVLTLRDINKLKKMRAKDRMEAEKKKDLLGVMYGLPEDDGADGGMGGGFGM